MRRLGGLKQLTWEGAAAAAAIFDGPPLKLSGRTTKTEQAPQTATSGAESANGAPVTKAELFSVPQEQMGHIQVMTVAPSSLPRVLRLTGTVAYNGFATTPVFTQIGGHVSRILAEPGAVVREGQPLLYVESPDYAQLRAAYLKARDAYALSDRNYTRSKDLYEHHAIAEADLQAAESVRTQAQADLQAAEQALSILGVAKLDDILEKGPSLRKSPCLRRLAAKWWSGWSLRGKWSRQQRRRSLPFPTSIRFG